MSSYGHLSNSAGEEVRTFRVKEYRNIGGRDVIWLTEVENHVRPTTLKIETLGLEWPQKADDTMFTRERLKEFSQRKK